ncbi:MAG: hypothetical protein WDA75_25805 [Candidatus Latescibacterota bacterium]|jgi:hypothetical protein
MVLERLQWHKPLRLVRAITIPVVIYGVLRSTLHRSSLGTLFVLGRLNVALTGTQTTTGSG